MKKWLALILATTTGLAVMHTPLAATLSFDQDTVSTVPPGWRAGVTGRGSPKWSVETDATAPSKPNVLKQSGSGTFPWCVRQDTSFADGYSGKKIRVLVNGKAYIDMEDGHIAGAGAVGVWTKADSVTLFDDFSYGAPSGQ